MIWLRSITVSVSREIIWLLITLTVSSQIATVIDFQSWVSVIVVSATVSREIIYLLITLSVYSQSVGELISLKII
jgi:hypothetical protein